MSRHTAHVSRTGLVIVGLILLLAGGAALARGLDASSATLGDSHASLLTTAQTRYPGQHGWVWWAVAAGGAVIALLALWWMAAQTSTRTVRRLHIEPDRRHGTTVLRAAVVTNAVADELESYTGIRAADAALRGSAAIPPVSALASKARPSRTCARPSKSTPSPPCCASSSAARSTGTSPYQLAYRASSGMRTWASGLPQPVTGSQPGAA